MILSEVTSTYLNKLKPSTADSFDGIPQIVYKKCALALYKPLTHIFYISLLLGEVPDLCETAIITFIPKLSPAMHVLNFTPISIIPTPSEVLQKIVREKLEAWFNQFHVNPDEQHGFRAGLSTLTDLVDSLHDWNLALNMGCAVDVIYVDLTKAFVKVNHNYYKELSLWGFQGNS
ncbi:hypothetical protein Y032_0102g3432 [Ancylostoma ceylanicum]|uniref:Reverse transcriptase domain-containing protein n=1 Tax=Ancylostoma ceylanicum TaxID=53326 RepID=A0A016THD8_9BILA|nr:hypothetical protein Y032_0102g3432 [Ancylostoma ceylanicum]